MTARVFEKTLARAGERRSFEIHSGPGIGWEIFERVDQQVTQRQLCSDWHRVERAVARFTREVAELRREGWLEADTNH